jgi:hypothetical protein
MQRTGVRRRDDHAIERIAYEAIHLREELTALFPNLKDRISRAREKNPIPGRTQAFIQQASMKKNRPSRTRLVISDMACTTS